MHMLRHALATVTPRGADSYTHLARASLLRDLVVRDIPHRMFCYCCCCVCLLIACRRYDSVISLDAVLTCIYLLSPQAAVTLVCPLRIADLWWWFRSLD